MERWVWFRKGFWDELQHLKGEKWLSCFSSEGEWPSQTVSRESTSFMRAQVSPLHRLTQKELNVELLSMEPQLLGAVGFLLQGAIALPQEVYMMPAITLH